MECVFDTRRGYLSSQHKIKETGQGKQRKLRNEMKRTADLNTENKI